MNKKFNVTGLLISIAVSLGVGVLSGLITLGSFNTYSNLQQPALAPPGWLFPVVWTVLYILMGMSAYLVYISDNEQKYIGLAVYGLQLIFNFLWSIIFFNLGHPLFAFVWLVILWILIVAMIISFYKVNPTAGLLQIPYLLWVTFAGYLNLSIYLLNK
ncbi:MAG: TspO/MBR family protein [Acutalibacteraceae bacterium]|nr:TspO/MBR family protein [Acutalibacteraceae bacterium]